MSALQRKRSVLQVVLSVPRGFCCRPVGFETSKCTREGGAWWKRQVGRRTRKKAMPRTKSNRFAKGWCAGKLGVDLGNAEA